MSEYAHSVEDMSESPPKDWTEEETLLLLKCYKPVADEFEDVWIKWSLYERILDAMRAEEFDPTVTVRGLEAKIKSLLHALEDAKDEQRRTGAATYDAPYKEQLEEIFEDNTIVGVAHTLNLGLGPTRALDDDVLHWQDGPAVEKLLKTKRAVESYFREHLKLKKKEAARHLREPQLKFVVQRLEYQMNQRKIKQLGVIERKMKKKYGENWRFPGDYDY